MILETHDEQEVTTALINIKEANLSKADVFKEEMIDLIDKGKRNILIDFKMVQYVDSSFLGAMVSSLKYAIANKADIAVINLSKDISDLFSLIRLDKVFNIYPNARAAIVAVKK